MIFKGKSTPSKRGYKKQTICGFTIIELIVTVSIFSLLTTLILVNHSKFSGAILLENLAYDVALSVREAQVFGLSVKEFEVGSGQFQQGYGVHFDTSTLPITEYVLFADRNQGIFPPNGKYDPASCGGSEPECIEIFTIQKGNIIKEFCATTAGGVEKCSPSDIDYLDIMFVRPNPDAIIQTNLLESYASARIIIKEPKGREREVEVFITGQISIPN